MNSILCNVFHIVSIALVVVGVCTILYSLLASTIIDTIDMDIKYIIAYYKRKVFGKFDDEVLNGLIKDDGVNITFIFKDNELCHVFEYDKYLISLYVFAGICTYTCKETYDKTDIPDYYVYPINRIWHRIKKQHEKILNKRS